MNNDQTAIHPGETLAEALENIDISAPELARRIGVPNNRLYAIIEGKRGITANTALRLGRFFRTGPEFWTNLQTVYELDRARREIGDRLDSIEPLQRCPAPESAQATLF